MRGARAPFKAGEVVASRFKPVTFHKLARVSKDGDRVFFRERSGESHFGNAHSYFRHLTEREKGG